MARCTDRRIRRHLVLLYHVTPSTYSFGISYTLTDWRNSDNISAHIKEETITICRDNAPRRRQANKIVAATIQGQ